LNSGPGLLGTTKGLEAGTQGRDRSC